MSDIFDSTAFRELKERYVHELEQDDHPEQLKMRLAAMAYALQRTLCHPSTTKSVPNCDSLEIIMRAVAQAIKGNPAMKEYVAQKLRVGCGSLMDSPE